MMNAFCLRFSGCLPSYNTLMKAEMAALALKLALAALCCGAGNLNNQTENTVDDRLCMIPTT